MTVSQTGARRDINLLWVLGAAALVVLVIMVAKSLKQSEAPPTSQKPAPKAPSAQQVRDSGIELFNKGKIKESILPLEQAVRSGKADIGARTTLALAYTATNRPKKAEAQYEAILKEKPKDAPTLYRLGLLEQQLNRPKGSVKLLEKAVAVDSKSALFRAELAKAYSRVGSHEKALAQWQQVLGLTPAKDVYRATVLAQIGDVYLAQNLKDKALSSYKAALAIDPANPYVKQQLSRVR